MPTFNAGAIEARLTLDRSPFTQGMRLARAQAQRVENEGINVKVKADRDELTQLDNDIRAMSKEERIDFDVNTAEAERKLKNFENQAERTRRQLERDNKIELKADLDAAKARAQLAVLARNRRIAIYAHVANFTKVEAQLRSLGRITMALSGANVVRRQLTSIVDNLENIDRVAYRLGGMTYLIGNISNVLLTASANTWTLIGSLGQLGGLLIPLPAYLFSIGSAVGVLAMAFTGWSETGRYAVKSMQDMKKVINDLTPAWQNLVKDVRVEFWEGISGPFKALAESTLPHLHTGLVSTADAMNHWALSWIAAVQNIDGSVWDNLFQGVASSIRIANGSIEPLVNAFAILGSVGSDNLDRLSEWFVRISERFDNFITAAAEDGRLQLWIDNAAIAFGDLGTVLGQFGGVMNGFSEAFKNAGSTTLSSLADTMTRIHEIVDSAPFQTALTTIFTGVLAGAGALADALGPVGDAIGMMAPLIGYLAEQIGVVLGDALVAIAGAMASPIFQVGLKAFFDGIATGIQALVPYLPTIAAGLGAVGQVAGTVLAQLGPSIGTALAGLAEIVIAIAPQLMTLANVLGGALQSALSVILPALLPVVSAVADLVVAFSPTLATLVGVIADVFVILADVIAQLLPIAMPLIDLLGVMAPPLLDVLVSVITLLASTLSEWLVLLDPIIQLVVALLTAIAPMLPVISSLVEAFMPLVAVAVQLIAAVLTPLLGLLPPVVEAFMPIVPVLAQLAMAVIEVINAMMPLIDSTLPILMSVIQIAMSVITGLAQLLTGFLAAAIRAVAPLIQGAANAVSGFADKVSAMVGRVRGSIDQVAAVFRGIKSVITGVFSGANEWLLGAATRIITGFISGVRAGFDKVRSVFSNLTDMIPDWKGPRERDARLLKPNAKLIMGSLINGIDDERSSLRRKLGEVTNDIQVGGEIGVTTRAVDYGKNGANGLQSIVAGDLILQAQPGMPVQSQLEIALFQLRAMGMNAPRTR